MDESNSFEEKIMNKVRESICEFITDEELSKIVRRVGEELFFKERKVQSGYTTKTLPPLLHDMVRDLLQPVVQSCVDKYFNEYKEDVLSVVDKVVSEGVGQSVVDAITNKFQKDLQTFKYSIQNKLK